MSRDEQRIYHWLMSRRANVMCAVQAEDDGERAVAMATEAMVFRHIAEGIARRAQYGWEHIEAMLRDSDRDREADETGTGSVPEGDRARAEGIAHPQSESSS